MKTFIISIFLWTAGLLFFLICFPFFFLLLIFAPRTITYKAGKIYFYLMIRIMGLNLVVSGKDNIDLNKSYIIMANHQSLFDVFIIPCSIPKPFVGIEASYHFRFPFWGWLIKKWGNIPIERKNREKAIESIKKAEKVLNQGLSIAIMPEGHRTITGEIGSFKKGGFYLAKNTKADILPLGISKSLYLYKNKNSWVIKPKKVMINIGMPLTYDSYKDFTIDQLKEEIKQRIVTLSNMN